VQKESLRKGLFLSTINTMARKKKRKRNREEDEDSMPHSWRSRIEPETKQGILAVLSFIVAALFVLSFIGKGGSAGGFLYRVFDFLLGRGYFFAPLMFVFVGFSLLFSHERKIIFPTILGGVLFLITSLTGLTVFFGNRTGGFVGALLGSPLLSLFDFWASVVIVIGLFVISLLLTFNMTTWQWLRSKQEEGEDKEDGNKAGEGGAGVQSVLDQINASIHSTIDSIKNQAGNETTAARTQNSQTVTQSEETEAPLVEVGAEKKESLISMRKVAKKWNYKKPPFELLQGDHGTPSSGDIRANANIIKRTFENFGLEVDMSEVSIGPTVTQYTLKPAEGVKLSRITALNNDLSLALAAHPIRIEAPIPGKSLVGIEVPNRSIATVGLRALLEHKIIQGSEKPLMFALGKDVSGNPMFADLARMPHLMVAGATGTGKSVCIHTIVSSLLYRNPPEVLRFIIIDPKRVELSVYNDIPHLLTPVITDPKTTVQALRWAVGEMDRRYELLSRVHVRDVVSYNAQLGKDETDEPLPYIIIIIDELADLMATFPREVEASIVRLAQMARAIGIHLIVSTQRPSVEVITGLIKANITSRIAFQVASQIDSRTILDRAGAEKLLGNGDMLFLAGDAAHPRRVQGSFISEQEVKHIVDFLREEVDAPEYDENILEVKNDGNSEFENSVEGDDPLYEEARALVVQAQKASASYLQRRLRVGYARAARLLDILEENGVVGPADGAKPREITIRATEADGENVIES
jgi:DNA segregation ATPase FtsK/SpoIIIE, S-DNA-T family